MSAGRKKDERVRKLLQEKKIVAIGELKESMGTNNRMTVFRVLRRLGYYNSYSHRGGFYTLPDIPVFDEFGLWSFGAVWFSKHGNLPATAKTLVEASGAGYTASELEEILHVETKHGLLRIPRAGLLHRWRFKGRYVYLSADANRCRQQQLMREEHDVAAELGMGLRVELLPEEARAAIILFFSVLDEKQRRLYAGLEAAKLGHGGDQRIAELFGLDPHTVARGRRELLGGKVERGNREPGGGRKRLEKKRLEL